MSPRAANDNLSPRPVRPLPRHRRVPLDVLSDAEVLSLALGSAAQSVTTGTGNDTINILGTSAESAFTLAAGGGNDTLAINGGGDLNMTAFAGITGIENVSIDDTATIFTANTANLAITAGNGGNTITLGSGTQSVNSGSGVDTINLGSGINVVNTGDGADIVNGALGTGDAVDLDARGRRAAHPLGELPRREQPRRLVGAEV